MKKVLKVLARVWIALTSVYGLLVIVGIIIGPVIKKIEEEYDDDYDFFEDLQDL